MSTLTKIALTNMLVDHGLVDKAALSDPEGYDAGTTHAFVHSFCESVLRSLDAPPSARVSTSVTETMIEAGWNAVTGEWSVADVYRAMLAAAGEKE